MIITDYSLFIEQLKVIDAQSYLWPWWDRGWLTAKEYKWSIIVSEGVVFGYSCYRITKDNNLFLAKLAVRPIYRGQSLGSLLMDSLIKVAEGRKVWTVLHEENAFLGWAKKWGWQCTELKKGFFPDGRDALVMLKEKEETDE